MIEKSFMMFIQIVHFAFIFTMGEVQERHYTSDNNRRILYTDALQKHKVYSEIDCAAYCARNDNCVIATFDQVTLTCYTDVEKNTSLTTGPMMNWTVLYKIGM